MFRVSIRTAVFATMITALLIAPGVTWAQSAKVDVPLGQSQVTGLTEGPDSFFDEGGNFHIRERIVTTVILPDPVPCSLPTCMKFTGSSVAMLDGLQEPGGPGSNGVFNGFTVLTLVSNTGLSGTFEGNFHGQRTEGTGSLVLEGLGNGTGDFEGMVYKFTTVDTLIPGILLTSGTLHSPHGF